MLCLDKNTYLQSLENRIIQEAAFNNLKTINFLDQINKRKAEDSILVVSSSFNSLPIYIE